MPQISLIKHSAIKLAQRFDAEYFKPEYLYIDNIISSQKFAPLSIISKKIDVGFVGSMVKEYRDSGVQLLQTKNIDEFQVRFEDKVYINETFHKKLKKSQVKYWDLLIARSWSFWKTSIYMQDDICNSSDIIIVEANSDAVNPFYLVAFMNCRFWVGQLIKFASWWLQWHVNLTILEWLKIPLLPEPFQLSIEKIVKSANQKQSESKFLYIEAEQILLRELGLLDYRVQNTLTFCTTSQAVKDAGRYDSEYFQPKYDEIIKQIESYEWWFFNLSDKKYVKISRWSLISDSFYNFEIGTPYIRGADFSGGILWNDKMVYIDRSFIKTNEAQVREGDIIFSLIGSVWETAIVSNTFDGAYISNNTWKISVENFHHIALQIILQSVIGKLQFEKEKTQTAQPKISNEQVWNFKIPLIKPFIQFQIAEKIQESYRLKNESRELLERAKKMVEDEVEKKYK